MHNQREYEELKKSEALKEADAAHANPLIDAVLKAQKCPWCDGKGMYYKNIMLDVAVCSCRSARKQGEQQ